LQKKLNLFISKNKKGRKCKAVHKEEIMTNGVVLIVLSNKGTKDVTFCNEKKEVEMPIVTKRGM
jgi:hypothetical protein